MVPPRGPEVLILLQVAGGRQTLPQYPQLLLSVMETHVPEQQSWLLPQSAFVVQALVVPARVRFASPKQASTIPATPRLNCFSACRRVIDWAIPLASSSNLVFICFPFVFELSLHVVKRVLRLTFERPLGSVAELPGEDGRDVILVHGGKHGDKPTAPNRRQPEVITWPVAIDGELHRFEIKRGAR